MVVDRWIVCVAVLLCVGLEAVAAPSSAPILDPFARRLVESCRFDAGACSMAAAVATPKELEAACDQGLEGGCIAGKVALGRLGLRKHHAGSARALASLCAAGASPACALALAPRPEEPSAFVDGVESLPRIDPAAPPPRPTPKQLEKACARGEPQACFEIKSPLYARALEQACARGSVPSCLRMGRKESVKLPPEDARGRAVVEACDTGIAACADMSFSGDPALVSASKANWAEVARERCDEGMPAACGPSSTLAPHWSLLTCLRWIRKCDKGHCNVESPPSCPRIPEVLGTAAAARAHLRGFERACAVGDGPSCGAAVTRHAMGGPGLPADAEEAMRFATFGCRHLDDPTSCDFVAARKGRSVPTPLAPRLTAQMRLCKDDSAACEWAVARIPEDRLRAACDQKVVGACVASDLAATYHRLPEGKLRPIFERLEGACRGSAKGACVLLLRRPRFRLGAEKESPLHEWLLDACDAQEPAACVKAGRQDKQFEALVATARRGSLPAAAELRRRCVLKKEDAACVVSKKHPYALGTRLSRETYADVSSSPGRDFWAYERACLDENDGHACEVAARLSLLGHSGERPDESEANRFALLACEAKKEPNCELAVARRLVDATRLKVRPWRKFAVVPFVTREEHHEVATAPEALALEEHIRSVLTARLAADGFEPVSREATVALLQDPAFRQRAGLRPNEACLGNKCPTEAARQLGAEFVFAGNVQLGKAENEVARVLVFGPKEQEWTPQFVLERLNGGDARAAFDAHLPAVLGTFDLAQEKACRGGGARPAIAPGAACVSIQIPAGSPAKAAKASLLSAAGEMFVVDLPYLNVAMRPGYWSIELVAEDFRARSKIMLEPGQRVDEVLQPVASRFFRD